MRYLLILALCLAGCTELRDCRGQRREDPLPPNPVPSLLQPAQETRQHVAAAAKALEGSLPVLDAGDAKTAAPSIRTAIVEVRAAEAANERTIAVVQVDVPKVYQAVKDLTQQVADEKQARVEAEKKAENQWTDFWQVAKVVAVIAIGASLALGFWLKDIHLGLSIALGAGVIFALANFMVRIDAFFKSAAWTLGIAAGLGIIWFAVEVLLRRRKTKSWSAAIVLSLKTSPLQDLADATRESHRKKP